MTSRQAKRAGRKQTAQFQYSASQMRRADRNEELEQRRQTLEDKEYKRKQNKRKRDEQAAKEREVRRKLLNEGKITLEDTWAKVTASQPRLNNFFTKKVSKSPKQPKPLSPLRESCNGLNKANGLKVKTDQLKEGQAVDDAAFDSEEDTLVDKMNAPNAAAEPTFQEFTDADLLQMFSSQPGPLTPSQKPLPLQPQHTIPASKPHTSHSERSNHKLLSEMTAVTPSKLGNAAASTPTKPATKATTPTASTNQPATPTTPARVPSLVLPSTEPSEEVALAVATTISPDDPNDPAIVARRTRSASPSPEVSPQRRGCRFPAGRGYNYDHVRAAASQQSSFSDDGLDDAALVAVASSAERRAAAAATEPRFEPLPFPVEGFSSSLPDEEMVEAARKVEEGGEAGKEEK